MIANVQLPLASIFVRLQKEGAATSGTLLPLQASSMRLSDARRTEPLPRFNWKHLSVLPSRSLSFDEDMHALLSTTGFALLLQTFCPTLAKKYHRKPEQPEGTYECYLLSQPYQETIIHIQQNQITIYGQTEPFASQMKACLHWYQRLGCPRADEYTLRYDEHVLMLSKDRRDFPLLMPSRA